MRTYGYHRSTTFANSNFNYFDYLKEFNENEIPYLYLEKWNVIILSCWLLFPQYSLMNENIYSKPFQIFTELKYK